MDKAREVAKTSNCRRRQVGALIVHSGVEIISATNHTPTGMTSCKDDGCQRCLSDTPSGESYDSCVCIHAEQSAIAQAAQMGLSTQSATMYSTLRPCLTCANLCLHAGVLNIIYDEHIQFTPNVEEVYRKLVQSTDLEIHRYQS